MTRGLLNFKVKYSFYNRLHKKSSLSDFVFQGFINNPANYFQDFAVIIILLKQSGDDQGKNDGDKWFRMLRASKPQVRISPRLTCKMASLEVTIVFKSVPSLKVNNVHCRRYQKSCQVVSNIFTGNRLFHHYCEHPINIGKKKKFLTFYSYKCKINKKK